jgi:flagellar protein FliO/FliZ
MSSTGLVLFWTAVVLIMIPLSLWLLKRSGMAGVGGPVDAPLKAISQLQLGHGQRVVTVQVNSGDQPTWLVLGVTAQQITTLHTMPAPAAATKVVTPPASFAQHLRRLAERQSAA